MNVAVIRPIHEDGIEVLRMNGLNVSVVSSNSASEPCEALRNSAGIIVRSEKLSVRTLEACSDLKVVSRYGVGVDNVPVDYLTSRGIPVTVVGDVIASSVAEHTMCLMLAICKRVIEYDDAVRKNRFAARDSLASVDLLGKTVLLIGFGRIGREVADRCRAFGMQIRAYDPYLPQNAFKRVNYVAEGDLDAALSAADFVSLHLPLTVQTRHFIDERRIRRMKPTAYLINCARGGLIDELALSEALRTSRLAGAALDVFEMEPPDSTNALLTLCNTIVTPHSAALTQECARRMSVKAAQNVVDALAGNLRDDCVVNRSVLQRLPC